MSNRDRLEADRRRMLSFVTSAEPGLPRLCRQLKPLQICRRGAFFCSTDESAPILSKVEGAVVFYAKRRNRVGTIFVLACRDGIVMAWRPPVFTLIDTKVCLVENRG